MYAAYPLIIGLLIFKKFVFTETSSKLIINSSLKVICPHVKRTASVLCEIFFVPSHKDQVASNAPSQELSSFLTDGGRQRWWERYFNNDVMLTRQNTDI